MRVLILTKIFPNREEPLSAPFNRQQFKALSGLCDVEILATIPWFPLSRAFSKWTRAGRLHGVPATDMIEGLSVQHPRVAFLPKVDHGLSGALYAASLAATTLRLHGRVDVVLGSWAYPDGFAAVVLAELLGVPAVIKLHGSDMNVVARRAGPRRCLEWAFSRADRVVAVSRPLRDAAIALGAAPDRVDIVRNGVDRVRFRPRSRAAARRTLGLSQDGFVVLYVGHVERHKGSVDLVRAFASISASRRDVSFVMVGDGAAMVECRNLAAELGVSVEFAGARPHDEVPTWLAACDVFVLPSWNEGTPNVVIEALACGRRVVATNVGGTPDVVTSAVLGTLVPPRAPRVLGAAIEAAVSTHYVPAIVSAALEAPDWKESARGLYDSLIAALSTRASVAA